MPDPVDLLKQHGLNVTAQRLAVLRAVSGVSHASADTITEMVRDDIGTVSRQAVYDALAVLTDKQILRRIEPPGSPARFDDRVGDNHHHLVCRICGRVDDADCATGEAPCLQPADDLDYVVDEAEVIFWGTCPSCQDPLT